MSNAEIYLKENTDFFVSVEPSPLVIKKEHAKKYAILFAIEQIKDIGNKSGDNPTWVNLLDKISELKSQLE